ncbi:helix-turn-helix domain-containing protein [Lacticaseibacillus parakribbianus]|uniref:helix-turn-helix domain-containing protein n=1 Tax=Lacticaseibacillus parakribbianus TaxID=2970927 RepID=UPI0021CAE869|nr:AraC family transcriptional regulator [Lacticaseibacillus parakribbianus]
MVFLKMALAQPATYLQSGEFSAALGWRHHRAVHGRDTELMLGVSGEVHLSVAGATYHLGPGDALVVFPHETIVGAQPTLTPSRFLWLHVVAEAAVVAGATGDGETAADATGANTAGATGDDPAAEANAVAAAGVAAAKAGHPTATAGDPAAATRAVLLPRFSHLSSSQPGVAWRQLLDLAHDPTQSALIRDYQASLVVLSLAAAARPHDQPGGQRLVNAVKEWVRINLAVRPSAATIAAHFDRNPDYLNRLFKQATGQTLGQYSTALRLDYAKLLLLSTSDTVAQVAGRAFFPDEKYFARVFHRTVGLPPSRYRSAYTHTFMNNDQVDPGADLQRQVAILEATKEQSQ